MTDTSAAGPSRIDGLFELAFRRHQAGELREAEALYRTILDTDPRQLDAHYYLGMIALQDGRPEAAAKSIEAAVAGNDRIPPYHVGLAESYSALGQRDDAITHYRKAVTIEPGLWAAQHRLAVLLYESGEAKAALEAISRALAAKDSPDGRALFVACVQGADRLPPVVEFRDLMIRALREAWARPGVLAKAAIAVIVGETTVRAAIHAALMAWPRRLRPPECGQAIGVLAQDELLHALMNVAPVNDIGLERLLTSVRTILLDAAVQSSSEVSREMIDLTASLARQCFINEYVFDVSDADRQAVAWLRQSVKTALAGRAPVFAIHLIALASYAPLHTLDRNKGLLDRKWLKPLEALINEQVREHQAELALRETMPRLTAVSDEVSQKVRAQYEDNPYPRWVSLAPTAPEKSIAAHLRGLLPLAPLRDAPEPEKPEILVAGCGTGQQPIGTAQRFPHARVLAIDLSLASLAYAKRKADAARVPIEFAQGDILELGTDRTFDMIESTGVLHHMAEPMRGWATLVKLLKSGGFMRIGLYSELGRQSVVAIRKIIAERNYDATPDGIRKCRQDVIASNDARFATIVHAPDFFSTSACRDLLFHVQEHRLTLPQIAAFLKENGLTLLGFELDAATRAAYARAFPDDATMTDLASWDRFETAQPDTFRAMYNFWVQKAS